MTLSVGALTAQREEVEPRGGQQRGGQLLGRKVELFPRPVPHLQRERVEPAGERVAAPVREDEHPAGNGLGLSRYPAMEGGRM